MKQLQIFQVIVHKLRSLCLACFIADFINFICGLSIYYNKYNHVYKSAFFLFVDIGIQFLKS